MSNPRRPDRGLRRYPVSAIDSYRREQVLYELRHARPMPPKIDWSFRLKFGAFFVFYVAFALTAGALAAAFTTW